MAAIIALVLNVIAFFYLKSWRPVVTFFKAFQLNRQIKAYRVAGLLVLVIAASVAHGQTLDVSKTAQVAPYSDGDDVIVRYYQAQPKPDAFDQMVWNNWYWFVGGAVAIFLFLQFGGGRESDDTNINDLADPDYRTAFVSNYHGDDAFEVPEGMHSEHMPVPVRSRSASAGR